MKPQSKMPSRSVNPWRVKNDNYFCGGERVGY